MSENSISWKNFMEKAKEKPKIQWRDKEIYILAVLWLRYKADGNNISIRKFAVEAGKHIKRTPSAIKCKLIELKDSVDFMVVE